MNKTENNGSNDDRLITRLSDDLISAKPLINAARYLQAKLPLVELGIETISPTDRFFIDVMSRHYYGVGYGGSATTLPNDVAEFIGSCCRARGKAEIGTTTTLCQPSPEPLKT